MMKWTLSLSSFVMCGALAACDMTHVSTVRMGTMVPPRPLDCELELIDAPAQGGIPPGLELLGYVNVSHEVGRTPNDPVVLKMVKPEACKLGGEKVSSGMSANYDNGLREGSVLSYMVWRRKGAPGAKAAPQKF
jgi:hypothetical protein